MDYSSLNAKEKDIEYILEKTNSSEITQNDLILFYWCEIKNDFYNPALKVKDFSVGTGVYMEKDERGNLKLRDAVQYIHNNSDKFKMFHSQKEHGLSVLENLVVKPDKVIKASENLHGDLRKIIRNGNTKLERMKEFLRNVRLYLQMTK